MRQLADSVVAVCICSSDHDELVALCHEITILRHGAVSNRLKGKNVSLASIIAAINHAPQSAPQEACAIQ